MKINSGKSQIKFFLIGVLSVLILLLFMGATNAPPPPNYGRFQLDSWATPINDGALIGAFVLDTATGETKMVYSRLIESSKKSTILTNDLKKQFINIK